MTDAEAFAPAKVNLALHVTGQRADGLHSLDSLVVFAGVGDRIRAVPGPLSLAVTGPRAAEVPRDEDNLVLRAARLIGVDAALALDKHLPAASGIGGGSADAAATLRALSALSGRALPPDAEVARLGADVPVCLAGRPARMRGAGEVVEPLAAALPPAWLVLVNPGVAVATPAVFAALARRDRPPMADPPAVRDAAALALWLAAQRNDLEDPARTLCPAIGRAGEALAAQPGCLMARMSGSGATVWGLFAAEREAWQAAAAVGRAEPGWWTAAAPMLG